MEESLEHDELMKQPFTLWYTEPPDEVFSDMQINAMRIWEGYDDTHGYASEKISIVTALTDKKASFMMMWNMMDYKNQAKYKMSLSPKTIKYLHRVLNGE